MRRNKFWSGLTALAVVAVFFTPSAAQATPPSNLEVEISLRALGLPVGKVDGIWDDKTRRAVCIWREITTDEIPHRKFPSWIERQQILETTEFAVPSKFVVGLHVSVTCQTMIWVDRAVNTEFRRIRRVFPVSTGNEYFPTPIGNYKIVREYDGWHESTLYEDAWMYRPKYFNSAMAMHGSATDDLVKTYPASHGCIRMLHSHIDLLWTRDVSIGTRVFITGEWKE